MKLASLPRFGNSRNVGQRKGIVLDLDFVINYDIQYRDEELDDK
jgi:hypothetical protein